MSALTAAALLLLLAEQPPQDAAAPYRVGPGDVLEVVVEGRPDLGRLPTVQTTGTIWLPRAGELAVRGLSVEEIAARIAPLLVAPDLEPPRVTVRVQEHHSQFVWTRGAVAAPGPQAAARRDAARGRAARLRGLPSGRLRPGRDREDGGRLRGRQPDAHAALQPRQPERRGPAGDGAAARRRATS